MDSEILISPEMPPETTCSGKSLLPRHVKCTVRMRALCRDESWAMVPIWAPSAAGTQYYQLFTHSAPRCHATTSVSAYTHRACIFEPLLNSHQECLCVCLAGHASEHRQTKDGSHEQHQCRRNAGDGASCTALGTRQSSSPLLAAMPSSRFHPFLFSVVLLLRFSQSLASPDVIKSKPIQHRSAEGTLVGIRVLL